MEESSADETMEMININIGCIETVISSALRCDFNR